MLFEDNLVIYFFEWTPSPEVPKFLLFQSVENLYYPSYMIRESTDKQQFHFKPCGLQSTKEQDKKFEDMRWHRGQSLLNKLNATKNMEA